MEKGVGSLFLRVVTWEKDSRPLFLVHHEHVEPTGPDLSRVRRLCCRCRPGPGTGAGPGRSGRSGRAGPARRSRFRGRQAHEDRHGGPYRRRHHARRAARRAGVEAGFARRRFHPARPDQRHAIGGAYRSARPLRRRQPLLRRDVLRLAAIPDRGEGIEAGLRPERHRYDPVRDRQPARRPGRVLLVRQSGGRPA